MWTGHGATGPLDPCRLRNKIGMDNMSGQLDVMDIWCDGYESKTPCPALVARSSASVQCTFKDLHNCDQLWLFMEQSEH